MALRRRSLTGVLFCLAFGVAFVGVVRGEQLPAVSKTNGRAAVGGGGTKDFAQFFGLGTLTVPITFDIGAQMTAIGGHIDHDIGAYGGVGGHLFWRDPSDGAIGVYSDWMEFPRAGLGSSGLSGEKYIGQWTFGGQLGGTYGAINPAFTSFGRITFYPHNDLMITGGHIYVAETHIGFAEIEWQPNMAHAKGLSVFALASVSEDQRAYVGGGVRWHFGSSDKPLIRRHREDIFDPNGATRMEYGMIASLIAITIITGIGPPAFRDMAPSSDAGMCPPGQIFTPGIGCI